MAVLLAVGEWGDRATACELCRRLGSPVYHVEELADPVKRLERPAEPIGGDSFNDARHSAPDDGVPAGALAFAIQGGKWPQQQVGARVELTYSYQNMFDGGLKGPDGVPLPASLIRESIEEALRLWASVAPVSFIEVADDGLSYAQGSTQFGQIRFRHIYINGPDPPSPQQPIAKAQAYFPSAGGNFAGDIEYDHSDPWQKVGTLPTPDILGATVHELGHSLGLGHSSNSAANMYWIFTRTNGPGTGAKLHTDDVAGVRAIYGAGIGSVAPHLPVPEPATWVIAVFVSAVWYVKISPRLCRCQPNRSSSLRAP